MVHQQALAIARDTGNRNYDGLARVGLGYCFWVAGQIPQAREQYHTAAEPCRAVRGQGKSDRRLPRSGTGARLDERDWAQARRDADTARTHGHGPIAAVGARRAGHRGPADG